MYVCTRARTRVCIRGGMVMGSAIRSIYGPIRAHELAIPNMPRGTVDRVREKEERKKGNDEIKSNQLRPSRIECPLVLSLSLVVSFFVFSLCVRARARSLARPSHRSINPRTSEAHELDATELNDSSRVSSRRLLLRARAKKKKKEKTFP